MAFFNNRVKTILLQLRKKNEDVNKEISKEIEELFEDLREEYHESDTLENEFSSFVDNLKNKLSPEEYKKLFEFSIQIHKLNRSAKKGVEAMRELSRDQKKATRETLREYEDLLHA
jgi:hypothetical protein